MIGTLENMINDMKHGVFNYTKDGKCIKCGRCCTSLLPITKEELKTIQRYVKRKHISIVKSRATFDFTCPFRNDELGVCTVYECRPAICRDFVCNKPQEEINETKRKYGYDNRFHMVNLREIFN